MDLHDEDLKKIRTREYGYIGGNEWFCSIDSDGRIIKLQIWEYLLEDRRFVLPPIII